AGLVTETLAATPNFIAFFNLACGGPRGGIKLVGDSNLDWGQDLTLLRDWQRKHPDVKLHVIYFGGAAPPYYVDAVPFTLTDLQTRYSDGEHVLAIGATCLQNIYPPHHPAYNELMRREPLEVLGGTVYLYRLPLRD